MIVVSNASPLIILAKIGHLELLNVLYGRILVPSEVRAEVVTRDAGLPGAHQVAQADWLDVRQLSDPATLSAAEAQSPLARGELAAILLAQELSADLILLDERAARRLAQARGLRVRGCVGILEAAFRNRYLPDLLSSSHSAPRNPFRDVMYLYLAASADTFSARVPSAVLGRRGVSVSTQSGIGLRRQLRSSRVKITRG